MKKKIFNIALGAVLLTLTACNDNKDKKNEEAGNSPEQSSLPNQTVVSHSTQGTKIIKSYLDLKNALADDNSQGAANAGNEITNALNKFDKTPLSEEQKKLYGKIEADAKEHAEHINKNVGNIQHQREHLDMLSKDIYDLVKIVGTDQVLYLTNCSMYNDNKGADWLSETEEIKNPYYGKEMSTCGVIKEKIKP